MADFYGSLIKRMPNGDRYIVKDPRLDSHLADHPSGGGSGNAPAPLTGDTYTAPGIVIPSGALDTWREARDNKVDDELVEVVIFGDSTTYGAANPLKPPAWYSWVRALKDAALADGLPDGGPGYYIAADHVFGYDFGEDHPHVTDRNGDWTYVSSGSRHSWYNTTGETDKYVEITAECTAIRLTFSCTNTTGKAAYSVDGGIETVVDTYSEGGDKVSYDTEHVFISGLTPGEHTLKVRVAGASDSNSGADDVEFQVDFVNDNGVVFHRNAMSGAIWGHYFEGHVHGASTENMTPIWMGMQSLNAVGTIDGARYEGALMGPKPQYRNVKLAIADFGTNDLGGGELDANGLLAAAKYLNNAAYFAATCRSVGCSGIIVAPAWTQLPQEGAEHMRWAKALLPSIALSYGVAYVDFQEPIGYDLRNFAARHDANEGWGSSHLTATAYEMQGQWLWEHVLAL